VDGEYTAHQDFWDPEAELVAPPDGYFLVGLRADTGWRLGDERNLFAGIAVDNLMNVRYRNYLNRLRYFADETGRSVQCRIRLEF
jgi:iron complex outermembrane receptor protein